MSQKAHENRKDFKFFEKTSVEEICLHTFSNGFLQQGSSDPLRLENCFWYSVMFMAMEAAKMWVTLMT